MRHPLSFLRLMGFLEGASFLVLLLIAMPLKYFAGAPEMVRIVGAIHGGLFVLYVIAVARAAIFGRWSILKSGIALAASLVPIGTFLLEPQWKREQRQTPIRFNSSQAETAAADSALK